MKTLASSSATGPIWAVASMAMPSAWRNRLEQLADLLAHQEALLDRGLAGEAALGFELGDIGPEVRQERPVGEVGHGPIPARGGFVELFRLEAHDAARHAGGVELSMT
jgi:hypothetical protein